MSGRIRIGEILLNAGVIEREQLNAALGEQRRWGRPLGATLVKMGFVDERSLVRALASQLALPVASLEGKRIAPDVLELVPAEIAEEHLVLPLFVKRADARTTLYLAMEDPGNLAVLDDLAFRTGLQVKPVMMAPSELCEGIDRYYRDAAAAPATPGAGPGTSAVATPGVRAGEPSSRPARSPSVPAARPMGADVAGADADADASAAAARAPEGTEELVRHFMSAGAPAPPVEEADPGPTQVDLAPTEVDLAPTAVDPGPAAADPGPTVPAAADEAAATEGAASEPPHAKFDEAALAAPPPRTGDGAGQAHGPVESLASYEAKTRTILHVLTQLLIEKGVISRDELHARVSALATVDRNGHAGRD